MKTKVLVSRLLLLSLTAVLSGCANRQVVVDSSRPAPAPLGREAAPPAAANAALGNLDYALQSTAARPELSGLSRQVGEESAATLSALGYEVANQNPSVLVSLIVDADEFDRSGNYYVYRGIVRSNVTRSIDRKVVAADTIEVRGDRQLGSEAALRQLGRQLSAATSTWIQENVTQAAVGVAAEDIAVTLPWYRNLPFNRQIAPYSSTFIREVRALAGVSDVRLVEQDNDTRTLTFRVVYLPSYFPEGLLNRLAQISELNIAVK